MATTTSAGNTIVKELLSKKNYKEWSVCMKSYLFGQDLWDVVEEDCTEPTVAWKRRNAAAFHAILISCGTEAVGLILDCSSAEDSARDAWDTLAGAYTSGNQHGKVWLHNKNYTEWRISMKSYLLTQGLWDVVVKPIESECDKSSEINVWKEKNAKAFDAILMSCGREDKNLIFDCFSVEDSARDAWNTLASKYNSGAAIVKELLNNENYKEWSVRLKKYLVDKDLWAVIESGNTRPSNSESAATSDQSDVNWKRKNDLAFHTIWISCEKETADLVEDCSSVEDSARDAWNTLASAYNSGATIVKKLLNKENYKQWSVDMKKYLQDKDLWHVVENGYTRPSESESGNTRPSESEIAAAADQSSVNWKRKNDLAFHSIWISCEKAAADLVLSISSAKDAWDMLAYYYGSDDEAYGHDPKYRPLHMAIQYGDWENTNRFFNAHPEALNAGISSGGKTALHVAAAFMHLHIVERLVELMPEKDLELEDGDCYNPLIRICFNGTAQIAKCIVNKNKKLLTIPDSGLNHLPVTHAVIRTNTEMARYLYSVTPFEVLLPEKGYYVAALLIQCLLAGTLDMALDLLRRYPHLAITPDGEGLIFVEELATMPFVFPSGCQLPFFQKWIYGWINVRPTALFNEISIDVQNSNSRASDGNVSLTRGLTDRAVLAFLRLLGINQIYETKLVHEQSRELLRITCHQIITLDYKKLKESRLCHSILRAAKYGIPEIIIEVIKANPDLAWSKDEFNVNFFFTAVRHRQAQIFSLIYRFVWKDQAIDTYNEDGFTMLHMAGLLAPLRKLNQLPGAAFQMLTELQWFKEVESMMPPKLKGFKNRNGMTARDLFTKEHNDLVKEGEKWMKQTATSCTVVGALIVTIMFTAAFTLPGGHNQNTGYPMFLDQKLFMVFIILDAISLYSSSTSVLLILGIFTSSYTEDKFMEKSSLYKNFIKGLLLLFISVVTMMAAFCVALSIMLKGKIWIVAPVMLLASVSIYLFVRSQFPFLIEVFILTFGSGIFDRNIRRWP